MKLTSGVNFIKVFMYKFFVQTLFQQLFWLRLGFCKKIVQKMCAKNVDEIDCTVYEL